MKSAHSSAAKPPSSAENSSRSRTPQARRGKTASTVPDGGPRTALPTLTAQQRIDRIEQYLADWITTATQQAAYYRRLAEKKDGTAENQTGERFSRTDCLVISIECEASAKASRAALKMVKLTKGLPA